MFAKRHYEFLAKFIREYAGIGVLAAEELADALKRENPRFNRERFLKACGFPPSNPD